jgi:hypothetical protein
MQTQVEAEHGRRIGILSCYEDGSFWRADTGSANSMDPAARRRTPASTGGPAKYYIGIDVSMKDALF